VEKVAKWGKAAKWGEGCQVPDARLPSTGLKAAKTAKTANATVTLVTLLAARVSLAPELGVGEATGASTRGGKAAKQMALVGLHIAGLKAGPSPRLWGRL
jgi:hypothetical protein